VTLARSVDRGKTFANHTLSDRAADPTRANLGDWLTLAALDGWVYTAWTEDVSSEHAPHAPADGDDPSGPSIIRFAAARFTPPASPESN
jgi:hypothetical protein